MKNSIITLLLILTFCLSSSAKVYLSTEQALKTVFKESENIIIKKLGFSKKERNIIEEKSSYRIEREYKIYIAKSDKDIDGYAIVIKEIGKHGIITFLVAVNTDGTIKKVTVLESNEIRGQGITEQRFLRQFKGKSLQDSIKLRRDIHAITGATISSNAAIRAVKKALIIWSEFTKESK